MYPLRFEPIFQHYLWGGKRLATQLGKEVGSAETCAESWEIVDLGGRQSRIAGGELQGKTLHELVVEDGPRVLGRSIYQAVSDPRLPESLQYRFPLLFKFLDAARTLSVQVHPGDDIAMLKIPPDFGKTEAWYVLDAEPGAKIYAGLQPGVDMVALAEAAAEGETESLLHGFEPQPGDCVFIPAGTVHAIGEGLLIAEIQQASDTTYRLYDWNRTDADGRSRDLHVDEAVHCTNYGMGPVWPQKAKPTRRPEVERLVACDKFTMNRWRINHPTHLETEDRFRLLAVTCGEVNVSGDADAKPLALGQTMLLPACLGQVSLEVADGAEAEFLEIFVPGEDQPKGV